MVAAVSEDSSSPSLVSNSDYSDGEFTKEMKARQDAREAKAKQERKAQRDAAQQAAANQAMVGSGADRKGDEE